MTTVRRRPLSCSRVNAGFLAPTLAELAQPSPCRALSDLYLAIRINRPDLVKHCLKTRRRLDPNSRLKEMSALTLAVLNRNEEIVRLLLDCGAAVDRLSLLPDGRIELPLHTAVRTGQPGIAKMLLAHGASPNQSDGEHRSALFLAARAGEIYMVEILIDAGANLNLVDRLGNTALHVLALSEPTDAHRMAIASLLIRHGACLNLRDARRRTLLEIAQTKENSRLAEQLLMAGCPIGRTLEYILRCRRDVKLEPGQEPSDDERFLMGSRTLKTVADFQSRVPSLRLLCVQTIRRHLAQLELNARTGCTIFRRIDRLPRLPLNCERALRMEETL